MRGRWRHVGAVIAAGTALVSLAGCGLSGANGGGDQTSTADGKITGEVTLQTWNLKSGFSDYINSVIKDFEKTYPGTTVKWIDQPGDNYEDKLLSQASAGELPDVTNTTPTFAYQLAKTGFLTDLSTVDKNLAKTYVKGAVAGFQFPGVTGTFAYPWYISSEVNYWNTAALSAAGIDPATLPTTLDGLFADAKKMKDAGSSTYLLSIKPAVKDLAAQGIPIINKAGTKFIFNTDKAVALVDKYRAAYQNGLIPDGVLTDKLGSSNDIFTKGTSAWTTGGGHLISGMVENNPSLNGNIVASKYFGIAPLDDQGLSVSKSSKNLPTAIALAKFFTNAKNQEAFAKLVPGIFPSTESSMTSSFADSDGTAQGDAMVLSFKGLTSAQVLEPPQLSAAMSTIFNQQISAAITGQKTSREALDYAVEKCNALLSQ